MSAHFGGMSGIAGQGAFGASRRANLPFTGIPEPLEEAVQAERGSHDQLVGLGARYASLHAAWSGTER